MKSSDSEQSLGSTQQIPYTKPSSDPSLHSVENESFTLNDEDDMDNTIKAVPVKKYEPLQ